MDGTTICMMDLSRCQSPSVGPDANPYHLFQQTGDATFSLNASTRGRYSTQPLSQLLPKPDWSAYTKADLEWLDEPPTFSASMASGERHADTPAHHYADDVDLALRSAANCRSDNLSRALALTHLPGSWISPSAPHTALTDPPPSISEVLEYLQLARSLALPVARKRAIYELLASDAFWADVAASGTMPNGVTDEDGTAAVSVSDSELIALFAARAWLQEQWRVMVLRPPEPCPNCSCSDPLSEHAPASPSTSVAQGATMMTDAYSGQEERHRAWLATFANLATGETRDVFRAIEDVQAQIRGLKDQVSWCDGCVEERVRAWDAVRETWWERLDDSLPVV
ncbi:hypothetical protein C8Q80DRAFT_1144885 [Daedaleopsis nitida]|nr:hypothetical protein C8Q80DRAFT_1144885 [Daedaleopsis nitida]